MEARLKTELARTGDESAEAAALRLRAAREAIQMSQIELGAAVGRGKSAISNMEKARSFVSMDVMRYLFREHRIDFNFMMAGLYAQLPGDVQDRLFAELATLNSGTGQKPSSD
ncbi:helix-turn-helix domain-containing protein [Maritimibacter sp. DP07]|uniref:Helix-turn-helix domain-containing protein n=1 Tax=Maritimibacter harenae TaxID=2606218 RepID=A0A845M8L8_9RHOB|nr:helix-turn-helix domain-containing protein [Maritimibacter harenae]MZR14247.1 helix-turn-helix domain-containing protein [Maritimibacter harenae]